MLGQESADGIAELFRDPCSIATSESFKGAMKGIPVLNLLELADDVRRPTAAGIRLRAGVAFPRHHTENRQENRANTEAVSVPELPRQYRIPTDTTTSCVLMFLLGA